MIFLVQFGINEHLLIFEKFTRAYLFQIALEIMWLPILILRSIFFQTAEIPQGRALE